MGCIMGWIALFSALVAGGWYTVGLCVLTLLIILFWGPVSRILKSEDETDHETNNVIED